MVTKPCQEFYLGIDAGGTLTSAVLISADGRVVGAGVGGPANHVTVGVQAARAAIEQAVETATQGVTAPPAVVALGSAGLEQPGDPVVAKALLPSTLYNARVMFDTDGIMALEGALAGDAGIVVAAGTGSIAMGRNANGQRKLAGGWGWRVGDEGSAYWIALQALMVMFKAADGRAPSTQLTAAVLASLQLADCAALRDWLYVENRNPADIAKLAPIIDAVALQGDHAAITIQAKAATELADAAVAVASSLALLPGAKVAVTGGVFKSQPIHKLFAAHIRAKGYSLVPSQLPPSGGAALHAWRAGQVAAMSETHQLWSLSIPPEFIRNLKAGFQNTALFSKVAHLD